MMIYTTDEQLIIKIENTSPSLYYPKITTICDRDSNGKLFGMEVFLYEESELNLPIIREQFSGSKEVEVSDDDLMYIYLRQSPLINHGPGFGRSANIGVTEDGLFSTLILDWNAPGAGTPYVDRFVALQGLNFRNGVPE